MTDRHRGPRDSFDWNAARERLERAARVISGEQRRTPEEARRILEARARQLARAPDVEAPREALELLVFTLAGERYGVESRCVSATLRLEHISLIPGAEPPVAGITAWRGEPLTLFDLREVTTSAGGALTDLAWIVVIGDSSETLGLLVDRVEGIAGVRATAVQPSSPGLPETRAYVRGVTDDAMLVLDADQLIRIYSQGERS